MTRLMDMSPTKPKDAATVFPKSERGDPLPLSAYGLGRVAPGPPTRKGLVGSAWLGQQGFKKGDQRVRWTYLPATNRSSELSTKVNGRRPAIIADSVDQPGPHPGPISVGNQRGNREPRW